MISIVLFAFGLVIGSFLGALSYRLPRSLNVTSDRSRCPNCNRIIASYDNIPLLSFLILGGKCRNCRKPISVRYPLIELATGIIFALIGLNIFALVFASILIAVFISDLETQIIPDELVFIGLFVFLIFAMANNSLYVSLLAGFLSADFLLVLNILTKGRGMGLGDVKLAILLGSLAGLKFFLIWFFSSFLIGSIVGILLIIAKKTKFQSKIAFGPFLILGLVFTYFFGDLFIKLLGF